ncbi:hydantoinase/oxoprolinase family protein [Falsiroseomonas oryzae]|uniref:hydantoinase/oxoprolinase family protein n=1 Tax=Falsiroseomonas oryzae TaxID=2766473 RepID=UPI0022EBA357|nr:hydantoinase/oxoprolinase family protein [Roseomonas sp. MO-31]
MPDGQARGAKRLRIGVDVGGTFTDLAMMDEATGRIAFHKVPSTPADPSLAIETGVREILARNDGAAGQVAFVGHGTTVATNMVIERRGARTAMLTTRGFRDVIEIARQTRPHLYDYDVQRPAPLVPRRRRNEIGERIAAEGTVLRPLDEAEVARAAEAMRADDVTSVAVCFLHAWRDPAHERAAKAVLRRLLPDAYLSVSSEVLPEFREFDRFSTTVLNAFVGPRMATYLDRLLARVRGTGIAAEPYTVHSNGGLMSVATAALAPVRTCLSGPAAGVIGAAVVAAQAGFPDVVTFDAGGTSTDVSVVAGGQATSSSSRDVAGYPVKVPSIGIDVIGAGGGSIAFIDAGGALKVGPRSAGADPGPAAYGRGGMEPTLTDANIVLGRLDQAALLRGAMPVDAEAARRAVRTRIAEPLGLTLEQAALGIIRIAVANMGRAIRGVTTERGYAPERFALFAFGGAGPLHATEVASECAIPVVIIPREPGTMCARGILLADIALDFVRSEIAPLDATTWSRAAALFDGMAAEADAWLAGEGVPADRRATLRAVELRYEGQNFEVRVPLGNALPPLAEVLDAFAAEHARTNGYAIPGREVELVNCRLTAIGKVPRGAPEPPPEGGSVEAARIGARRTFFDRRSGWCDTPVYARERLPVGGRVTGPAIIEEMSSTSLVFPGQWATLDAEGNLIIRHESAAAPRAATREHADA